ncbi:hypothetical protein KY290_036481 [Solanum tuberosum]|uniref:Uncharacterized protein n=1 Tax=Solanum tuberosum TaxID=4113 RepID=A0ABQ7TUE5_SOLTU|nr:hypothetical protein KY285_035783 [Solanum tuberosum]KAH0737776.1 hypothetical protein KY290_036481 [Solanum tuberosum]
MAREPPAELPWPPNEYQTERLNDSNKTHPATLSNSPHNSMNSQNTDAINTAISVKELDGTREIISPGVVVFINEKGIGNMESPSLDLHHSKNPVDFTVPTNRNREGTFARNANESQELLLSF